MCKPGYVNFDEGKYAAIILAAAGLTRLELSERITALLDPEQSLPAVGQGALGIECRSDRTDLVELLSVHTVQKLHDYFSSQRSTFPTLPQGAPVEASA